MTPRRSLASERMRQTAERPLTSYFFMRCGLDCLGPQALIRRAPPAHRPTEMAPGEREHSDPKGHAGPSATTRPVNSGTRERGSGSGRRRRAPFPSAPGEEFRSVCARDRSRTAETQSGSVHMWTAPDLQGLALAACSDRLRSYVRPVFGSCDHRPRWASRTVRSKHESGIFCR